MVFGRKTKATEEPPITRHLEATEHEAVEKMEWKANYPHDAPKPPTAPPQRTPQEARLQFIVDDINRRYAVFNDTHFPNSVAPAQANLLTAIYGELYDLNENILRLVKLVEAQK